LTRVLLLGGESNLVGAQVAMMWPQTRESLVVEWGKRRMTWWQRTGGHSLELRLEDGAIQWVPGYSSW
jgi:hypothetical protein